MHDEGSRPNRAKRLKLPYRALYVNAERTHNYMYQYTEAEGNKEDNRELTLEVTKAQMLNIPPIKLTQAKTIKPKDRRLIDAYFRDFNADSREHAYAMTRKRARRKEREALGRRSSRRTTREPDRLIANSINLMPTTLMAQREELNYYLDNDEIGQLVKEVLATTNIYG